VVVVENAFRVLGERKGGVTSRIRVVMHAAQEVAPPVVLGVGIIVLVFLPLMTLQGMEGKMFAPLAFTIAIALLISLLVSLTLSPVLCSFFLEGHQGEHDTQMIARMKGVYLTWLHWSMRHRQRVMAIALGMFLLVLGIFPFLGTSFMPEMKEGSIVPNIIRMPNISLEESAALEMRAMKYLIEVPGVANVVTNIGRGESPADPQSQNESTPIVTLKPRNEWPSGWDQMTISDAISEKLMTELPGVQVVMAQPISAKVAEMVTGVRSDVAVKVFGDDLAVLKSVAEQIAVAANDVAGVRDVRVERLTGQDYLNITLDRQAIARHGLNSADIHDAIEMALAGKVATEIYQGERRFSAAVRLPERFRDSVSAIDALMLTSSSGARVPLGDVTQMTLDDGPAQISREMGKRRVVVGMNVRGRDLGGFVEDLQRHVQEKVVLPEGCYLQWGGQFQNMERALGHLTTIIPLTIAAIFFLLFMLFKSVRFAGLIILVLPFASIGGVVSLMMTGEYLSVPASVGFIALWGIAVLNGVVLVSYIKSLREKGESLDQAIFLGCEQRFRPVMMTATVALLGLVPFLFATGPGSEVQKPLAIVVIGGLVSSTLLTLLVLPTLYALVDQEKVDDLLAGHKGDKH
jgi:heavy metal efflux system protein